MLTHIHPKLPMRNKPATLDFYTRLGFEKFGGDYPDYLMMGKDGIQIHFFLFADIDPLENDGQVYIRAEEIDDWYQFVKTAGVKATTLETKPWKQKEFSVHDPDNNVLTFGESAQ